MNEYKKNYIANLNQYYSTSHEAPLDYKKVKWGSRESQFLRFKILSQISEDFFESSVLDYGCGTGAFLEFLQQHSYSGKYAGYDILPKMLELAEEKYQNACFINTLTTQPFDFVVASGIFTITNLEMMHAEIQKMYQISQKGIAFNSLSIFSSLKQIDEFYADPIKVLEFCFKLTPKIVLKHDYLPHDFTIYMYK